MEILTLSPLTLIGIGIALIAAEALVYSFFIVWFGVGTIIVGGISYFYHFENGLWQLASVAIISVLLLLLLRTKISNSFLKEKDSLPKEDFLNKSGFGVIAKDKLYFKATYWDIFSLEKDYEFSDGEKVAVVEAIDGVAHIKKI